MSITYLDSSSIVFIDDNDGGTVLAPEGGILPPPYIMVNGLWSFDDARLFTIEPRILNGEWGFNDFSVISFATLDIIGILSFDDLSVMSFGIINIIGVYEFDVIQVEGILEPITEIIGGVIPLDGISIVGYMVIVIVLHNGVFQTDDINVECDIHVVPFEKLEAWLVAAGHNQTLERVSGSFNPVVLVYFPEFDRTFGSRLVPFRAVEREILSFSGGGLGPLSITLDENTDKAKLSGGSLLLLNQEKLSDSFTRTLINKTVEIYVGFTELEFKDYLLIYTLTVDKYSIDYNTIRLSLVDTTLRDDKELSVPIGQQYFPGAPQESRSKSIPIIVGILTDVPTIQVRGDAVGTLAFDFAEGDSIIYINESTALFADIGQVIIGTDVLQFTNRQIVNIYGKMYLSLTGVTHVGVPQGHLKNDSIQTYNNVYIYVVGYGVNTLNAVRENGIVLDPSLYTVTTINADQPVTALMFGIQRELITVDVNAANIDTSTVLVNGTFETGDITGWINDTGILVVGTTNPAARTGTYRGEILGGLNTYFSVYQDATVLPHELYDYGFSYRNDKAAPLFINAGFEDGLVGWIQGGLFNAIFEVITMAGALEGSKVLKMRYVSTGSLIQNYSFELPVPTTSINALLNGNLETPGIVSPWITVNGGVLTVDAARARLVGPGVNNYGDMYQDFVVSSGALYKISVKYNNVLEESLVLNGYLIGPISSDTGFTSWVTDSITYTLLLTGHTNYNEPARIIFQTPLFQDVPTRTDLVGFFQMHQDITTLSGQTYQLGFSYGIGYWYTDAKYERRMLEGMSKPVFKEMSATCFDEVYASANVFQYPRGWNVMSGLDAPSKVRNVHVISQRQSTTGYGANKIGHFFVANETSFYYEGSYYGAPTGATYVHNRENSTSYPLAGNMIVFFAPWNMTPVGEQFMPAGSDQASHIDTARQNIQRDGIWEVSIDLVLVPGHTYNLNFLYETVHSRHSVLGVENQSYIQYRLDGVVDWTYVTGVTHILYDPPAMGPQRVIYPSPFSYAFWGVNAIDPRGEDGFCLPNTDPPNTYQSPTIRFVASAPTQRFHLRFTGTWSYLASNRTFYFSKARAGSVVCYEDYAYSLAVGNASYVQYAVGIPENETAYVGWTNVGIHQSIYYADTWNTNLISNSIIPITMVVSGVTTRISFRLFGNITVFPGAHILRSEVILNRITFKRPGDICDSQAAIQIGTSSIPTTYYNADLTKAYNPIFFDTTILSTDTVMRLTLRSKNTTTAMIPTFFDDISVINQSVIPYWSIFDIHAANVAVTINYNVSSDDAKMLCITASSAPVMYWDVIIGQDIATVPGQDYAFTFGYVTTDKITLYGQVPREISWANINYQLGTIGNPTLYVNGNTGQSHLQTGTGPGYFSYVGYHNVNMPPYTASFIGYTKTYPGKIRILADGSSTWPLFMYIPYIRFTATSSITRLRFVVVSYLKHYDEATGTVIDGPSSYNIGGMRSAQAFIDNVTMYPIDKDVPVPPQSSQYIPTTKEYRVITPLTSYAELYQDISVVSGDVYTMNFAYKTIRNIYSTVTPYVQSLSDLAYTVGTPINEQQYVLRKQLGQSHVYQNATASSSNPTTEFIRIVNETFTVTSNTLRVKFIFSSKVITADGSPPPYNTQGFPLFLPSEVLLDDTQLAHGFGLDQSSARILIGTPAQPNFYRTLTLTPQFNWTDVVGVLTPREATIRITLQSRYAFTPFKSFFDDIFIQSAFSYSQQSGGQNPIDAMLYLMTTFTPNVAIDTDAFLKARSALREWKFGGLFVDPGFSNDFFQEMARQCKCLLLKDAAARWTIMVLDDAREVKYFFDKTNISENVLFERESPPNDVLYTEIYVYFGTKTGGSTSTGDFSSVVYATPTEVADPEDDDLRVRCQSALDFYQREQRLDFFASWIQDYLTARYLLRWLVSRHTSRQESISFETWVDAMPVRIGEVAILNHPVLPSYAPVIAELIDWNIDWGSYSPHLRFRILGLVPPAPPVALDVYIESTLKEVVRFSIIQYITVSESVTLDLATVDLDPLTSGNQQTVIVENNEGQGGTFVADLYGRIQFTPRGNDNGHISTDYTYRDSFGTLSNIGTITINVLPFIGSAKSVMDSYDSPHATKVFVARSVDIIHIGSPNGEVVSTTVLESVANAPSNVT